MEEIVQEQIVPQVLWDSSLRKGTYLSPILMT